MRQPSRRRPPKNPCVACGRGLGRARRCPRCGAARTVRGMTVEAVLHLGPRGRVYRARTERGEEVLLKEVTFATVPDVLTLELFGRECAALQRLSHPRIPRFIDGFREGEGAHLRLYLVQSHLPGENLETKLAHHSFDEAGAQRIADDVLEILDYLHTRSPLVVHRDVKPSNLIALEDGRFGLVDFGLVRSGAPGGGASSVLGTFGYLPPEQLFRAADQGGDLYGLGMTLCRLLSRRRPDELLTPGLEVAFHPHVNVAPPFASWLERLVAKDPARRFSSAGHALAALEQARPASAPTRELRALPPPPPSSPSVPEHGARPPPLSPPVPEHDAPPAPAAQGIPWRLTLGGRTYLLRPGESYLAGRDGACALHVEDPVEGADTVSRRHLRLTVGPGGVEVEELGSRNGTWVGRQFIRPAGERVRVREGVELQLGEVLGELVPAFLVVDASPVDRPLSQAKRRLERSQKQRPVLLGYLGGDPEGVRIYRPGRSGA